MSTVPAVSKGSSQIAREEDPSEEFSSTSAARGVAKWFRAHYREETEDMLGDVLNELPQEYLSQSRNVASSEEAATLSSGSPGFVGVNEKWDSVTNIDARILEVTGEQVKLECLMSASRNEFQERVFERSLLQGVADLKAGNYILIRIFKRSGKITFAFHDGGDTVRKNAFEDLSRFDDLDDLELDRMVEQQ